MSSKNDRKSKSDKDGQKSSSSENNEYLLPQYSSLKTIQHRLKLYEKQLFETDTD